MANPLDELDEYLRSPLLSPVELLGRQSRRKPAIAPLPVEEEDSALNRLLGKTLSGVQYAGAVLGKTFGGRALRGYLGGKPHELASIIPLSDTLGITNQEDEVRGEDLLKRWGHHSGDPQGTWGDTLKGIGLEIALDPGTYLTFGGGALTPLGKAASKIGVLPKNIPGRLSGLAAGGDEAARLAQATGKTAAEVAGQRLGGHVGVGLPFSTPAVTLDLTGPLSALASLPGVPAVSNLVRRAADPLLRYGRAAFDPEVRSTTQAASQEAARAVSESVRKGAETVRGLEGDLIVGLQGSGLLDDPSRLRRVFEGFERAPPEAAQLVQRAQDFMERQRLAREAAGLPAVSLEDLYAQYFPRFATPAGPALGERGLSGSSVVRGRPFETGSSKFSGREPGLTNVPGGTDQINRLSTDPAFSGWKRTTPQDQWRQALDQRSSSLRGQVWGWSQADEAELAALRGLQRQGQLGGGDAGRLAALEAEAETSRHLANILGGLDPRHAEEGIALFGGNPVRDFVRSALNSVETTEAAKGVHRLAAQVAGTADELGPNAVRLSDALQQAGVSTAPGAGGLQAVLGELQSLNKLDPAAKTTALRDLYVPAEIAADMGRMVRGFQAPLFLQRVGEVVDSITNLTKTFQTSIWPAFHTRNFVSGVWQNGVIGALDPSSYGNAFGILRGAGTRGLAELPIFQGLTEEQAASQLGKLAHQYGVTGLGQSAAKELSGGILETEDLLKRIPGLSPYPAMNPLAVAGRAVPKSLEELKPWNVAGFGARTEDAFSLVREGRQVGAFSEDLNRLAGFEALLRQGYAPEQAAMKVRAAHVDYSALSDFERAVMRRAIPFYAFSRRMIPFQIREIASRPGGPPALAVKVSEGLRDDAGFIPPHLGGGMAIPVGPEDAEGQRRFLTRVDLPHEQMFEFARPGTSTLGTIQGTGRALLSQMNPLAKAPVELTTGKQLYTGRNLEDLYSPTGSTVAESLLMNSPLSRFYTTGRQIADRRKDALAHALNLGTGVKLSDVDLEKHKNLAARQLIEDLTKGSEAVGKFEKLYVKPGDVSKLTPTELELVRLNKTLEEKAKARAKDKAKRNGVAPK